MNALIQCGSYITETFFISRSAHFLMFPFFVYNYKTANKEEHRDLVSALQGAKCVSSGILTSKYTTGVKAQCSVWFLRSSGFCKRCFVIWIPSLIFWPHSKPVPVQALDFVDFLIFIFLVVTLLLLFSFPSKGEVWLWRGMVNPGHPFYKTAHRKRSLCKVTWNSWTHLRYQVWRGKWRMIYGNGL